VNTLVYHLVLFALIYFLIAVLIFIRLAYLARKYMHLLPGRMVRWFRPVLADSLSWPYYVIRYGIQGFFDEIK